MFSTDEGAPRNGEAEAEEDMFSPDSYGDDFNSGGDEVGGGGNDADAGEREVRGLVEISIFMFRALEISSCLSFDFE